ncbi:putative DNA replication complex GINS protein [Hamiltosporidium tvaerminnensis]|uniref:Putative DNA replication complex GINS protein n=1 Tax=Hamiltosporidium tvaerminnensis TaxID=1176355 RepID=A0A4V2JYG8_9MICR|nr:putative DNA replication complex GINS protein [Hamiltosporidium tvaerminnensis]
MEPDTLKLIAHHNYYIQIETTANIPPIHLLSYTIPPLKPLSTYEVPLYIALSLKNSNMCKIKLPSSLSLPHLLSTLQFEISNTSEYSTLHPYFFETAYTIITNSYNVGHENGSTEEFREIKSYSNNNSNNGLNTNISNNGLNTNISNNHTSNISNITTHYLYKLVLDIKDIRFSKTYNGIHQIDTNSLNLNNLTIFEFNEIKHLLLSNMEIAKRIKGISSSRGLVSISSSRGLVSISSRVSGLNSKGVLVVGGSSSSKGLLGSSSSRGSSIGKGVAVVGLA